MLCLLVLGVLVGVAVGGRSPHAKYVEEFYEARSGARYSTDVLEDAKLDVPGLVSKYGYPIEIHEVTTDDGYILTMHRIPYGKESNNDSNVKRPVVFLMHGLLSSSADYLVLGPRSALGYYLADEGYDVWLGNARGNFYSRRHVSLNPDSSNQAFWRFSWDEIGNRDLPAFIDYVLATTQQSKLHYVGHSQGGTTFLVLNSLRPEYNAKFVSFQGLAPASFFTYNEHPTFRALAPLENILETAVFALGMAEVLGSRDSISEMSDDYCSEGSVLAALCDSFLVSGKSDYYNETMQPVFSGHAPAGASIRQFAHYAQSIRFNTFRRYNYNRISNLANYGSWNPPDYDLSRITVPSYIHYSTNDLLVHPKDVQTLCSKLPNLGGCFLIDSETFDHVDFIWGNGVRAKLYEKVLSLMRDAERRFL